MISKQHGCLKKDLIQYKYRHANKEGEKSHGYSIIDKKKAQAAKEC